MTFMIPTGPKSKRLAVLKVCKVCGESKSLNGYKANRRVKGGYLHTCNGCRVQRQNSAASVPQ